MDRHIKKLFEQAQPFDEEEIIHDRKYLDCVAAVMDIEREVIENYGKKVLTLFAEHLIAQRRVDKYEHLHYFRQGYLAARKELEKKKDK